jgi:hypothetical protein
VVIMGAGLRPIGKPMDSPPYPTITRAPHFYPDYVAAALGSHARVDISPFH